MSMQEPTDDQLDGLFRKSAEDFDTPFDPAAWQVLKNRLDTHDRLTVWEHLLRWGLPVLLLLLLTAGSWNANRLKNRIQTQADQRPGSGLVGVQAALVSADPALKRSTVRLPQRTPNGQTQPSEVAANAETLSGSASNPANPERRSETGAVEPGKDELSVSIAKTTETVTPGTATGAGITAATTSSRSAPAVSAKARGRGRSVTTANRRFASKAVTGGSNSTAGGKRAMVPEPTATDARIERTISRPAGHSTSVENVVVDRAERAGTGTTGSNSSGRLRRLPAKRTDARAVATFPVTDPAIVSGRYGTGRKLLSDAAEKRVANASGNNSGLTSPVRAAAYSAAATTPPQGASITDAVEPQTQLSFVELTNRPGSWPAPITFAGRDVVAPLTPITATEPERKPAVSQKGLSVRFLVSPDLSAVGLRDFQRPGTNVGLLLEYRLASHWSVQTGIIQSTKVYKASTTEYELPANTQKWKVFPESVNGRCTMFDIPINIRYDIALRPRADGYTPSRWFVSGGTTTYIMQREDYVNNFADKDKAHVYPGMEGWHGKTGAYGFSQLNLSAGYERALSRRLSWQVEPFVKVPLKGVGYFKVDLLSTGAFFSLRYKLF